MLNTLTWKGIENQERKMSGIIKPPETSYRRVAPPRLLFSPIARLDADDRIRRFIYGVLFYLTVSFTHVSGIISEVIGLPKIPFYGILIPLITWQFIKRVP